MATKKKSKVNVSFYEGRKKKNYSCKKQLMLLKYLRRSIRASSSHLAKGGKLKGVRGKKHRAAVRKSLKESDKAVQQRIKQLSKRKTCKPSYRR